MKLRLLALGGLAAVLGIGVTLGVSAQAPTSVSVDREAYAQRRERHPELVAALRALRNAKTRLQKADRDFGGHRAKAVEHTDAAISEVEAAIEFDRK
jgi:hypothetical protein